MPRSRPCAVFQNILRPSADISKAACSSEILFCAAIYFRAAQPVSLDEAAARSRANPSPFSWSRDRADRDRDHGSLPPMHTPHAPPSRDNKARGRLVAPASVAAVHRDGFRHAATFPCPSRRGYPSDIREGRQPAANVLVWREVASSVKKCRAHYTRKGLQNEQLCCRNFGGKGRTSKAMA
jgi:hypothetical protein